MKKGDIVIIGDNSLGKDDGGMTPKDLKLIGIEDGGIRQGDPLIAVGIFGRTMNDIKTISLGNIRC